MPSSAPVFKDKILQKFIEAAPKNILEIGCGFGHWGVEFRQYADIFRGRYDKNQWQAHIVGVEAFEPYINPIHDYVYDTMFTEDISKIVDVLPRFDFCYAGDVLEHLEKGAALHVIRTLRAKCKLCIFQIPFGMDWDQGPVLGNQFETHRSVWTKRDFLDCEVEVQQFRGKDIGLIIC